MIPAPRRVLLGLGSNLGDRRALLAAAVASIKGVTAVSPVYETEPVGGPDGQGPFLNIVVAAQSALSPRELLAECARLEAAAGRIRNEHWGPRTLDVDILWIDGETVDLEDLAVPHRRMRDRAFVMAPLADIAPDVAGPVWWETATGHVERVGPL